MLGVRVTTCIMYLDFEFKRNIFEWIAHHQYLTRITLYFLTMPSKKDREDKKREEEEEDDENCE